MGLSPPKHGNVFPNIHYIMYSVGLGKFVQYAFAHKNESKLPFSVSFSARIMVYTEAELLEI